VATGLALSLFGVGLSALLLPKHQNVANILVNAIC
jgi:hypothetical protein